MVAVRTSLRVLLTGTLGKAMGGYGAFVAGASDTIEWILQSARSYLFTTATPPAIAAAMQASLDILQNERERLTHLRALIDFFPDSFKPNRARLPYSMTAIQPVIVGSNGAALAMSEALMARHMFVPVIRPPTVPQNTARLRVSITAEHNADDLLDLATALLELEAAHLGERA